MEFVQPIRDKDQLEIIKKRLKAHNERDYVMFMIGINAGLRISDILQLRVRDVRGEHIKIKEMKTGKTRRTIINRKLRKALDDYIKDKPDEEVLIKSRQGTNKAIDRSTAYKILKEAAREVGLTEIGTHTMRKTFGYHFYQRDKDVVALQKILNHNKASTTLLYIGVEQDYLDERVMRNGL